MTHLSQTQINLEVTDNLRHLLECRDFFDEQFVARQLWVCLRMLGGMAGAW